MRFSFRFNLFKRKNQSETNDPLKKFLIVGLGNIGDDYRNTRHNVGFDILDALASDKNLIFEDLRYGAICKTNIKGKSLILLKPSTLMNRSGKAVRYWAIKENIQLQNILIVTDDLNIPFGKLRLKPKGSDGGHNGLKDIEAQLNTPNYSRLRFGIYNENKTYDTISFVLGVWSDEEQAILKNKIEQAVQQILTYTTQGIAAAMNQFNK